MTTIKKDIYLAALEKVREGYDTELRGLPLKKNAREDLSAGHADGVRNGAHAALRLLGVTIED